MRIRKILHACLVSAILLASVLALFAQSTTSLRGIVTDPTGAIIPGAVVSLTNLSTGFKRQALSGEDGVFQFLQAPPGSYQVTFEKAGFATVSRDMVQLLVN